MLAQSAWSYPIRRLRTIPAPATWRRCPLSLRLSDLARTSSSAT